MEEAALEAEAGGDGAAADATAADALARLEVLTLVLFPVLTGHVSSFSPY
jgi:hypothetical protein